MDIPGLDKESLLLQWVLSPQEQDLMGGSTNAEIDYYTPQKVLQLSISVEAANKIRQEMRFFFSLGVDMMFPSQSHRVAIKLCPLGPDGRTTEDPVIAGLLNKETGELEKTEDAKRMTIEMYRNLMFPQNPEVYEVPMDFKLRDESLLAEIRGGKGLEEE